MRNTCLWHTAVHHTQLYHMTRHDGGGMWFSTHIAGGHSSGWWRGRNDSCGLIRLVRCSHEVHGSYVCGTSIGGGIDMRSGKQCVRLWDWNRRIPPPCDP